MCQETLELNNELLSTVTRCSANSGDANNETLLGKQLRKISAALSLPRLLCVIKINRGGLHLQQEGTHRDTDLHGLVELVRGGQDVDAGARHPEGRYVVRHPSEARAEAVCALSSGRPGGSGDAAGSRVGLGQEWGQEQHRGPGRKPFCVIMTPQPDNCERSPTTQTRYLTPS